MQYVAFALAVFGFYAYLELSSLKKRISDLEQQLAGVDGTSYAADRASVAKAAASCIGREVSLTLKDDCQDPDIMYGNTRHGKNTILDADNGWVLIRSESPKGSGTKLLRLESIRSIQPVSEPE